MKEKTHELNQRIRQKIKEKKEEVVVEEEVEAVTGMVGVIMMTENHTRSLVINQRMKIKRQESQKIANNLHQKIQVILNQRQGNLKDKR